MQLPQPLADSLLRMIEGTSNQTWHHWWAHNSREAERCLSRAEFLQLKFRKLEGAAEMLSRDGVNVTWHPSGRRLAAWAKLHADAVDDLGRPRPEIRRKRYGGALAAFEEGDLDKGELLIARAIDRILGGREPGLELGELVLDIENLGDEGHPKAAKRVGELVARLSSDDTDVRAAIQHAEQVIAKFANS